MKTKLYSIVIYVLLGAFSAAAQTGGTYDLSHNVVAGGGEMQSTGGSSDSLATFTLGRTGVPPE